MKMNWILKMEFKLHFLIVVVILGIVNNSSASESKTKLKLTKEDLRGRIVDGSSPYNIITWRRAARAGAIRGGVRLADRLGPGQMPTICTNKKVRNSDGQYGYFVCPGITDERTEKYCCGGVKAEYCCDELAALKYIRQHGSGASEEESGLSTSTTILIIFGVGIGIAVLLVICKSAQSFCSSRLDEEALQFQKESLRRVLSSESDSTDARHLDSTDEGFSPFLPEKNIEPEQYKQILTGDPLPPSAPPSEIEFATSSEIILTSPQPLPPLDITSIPNPPNISSTPNPPIFQLRETKATIEPLPNSLPPSPMPVDPFEDVEPFSPILDSCTGLPAHPRTSSQMDKSHPTNSTVPFSSVPSSQFTSELESRCQEISKDLQRNSLPSTLTEKLRQSASVQFKPVLPTSSLPCVPQEV